MSSSPPPLTSPASAPKTDLATLRTIWREHGLSTLPADRKKAEAAIKKMYAIGGLAEPERIVWCGSPFSMSIARAIVLAPDFIEEIIKATWKNALKPGGMEFKNNIADCFRSSMRLFDTGAVKRELMDGIKRDVADVCTQRFLSQMAPTQRTAISPAVWSSIWTIVWDSLGADLSRIFDASMRRAVPAGSQAVFDSGFRTGMRDAFGESVKFDVWEQVMDTCWGNIRNAIGSQERVRAYEDLWRSLQVGIWENVALRIGAEIKAAGTDAGQRSAYGQHDAYWLAFYAYFRDIHALKNETEPVSGLLELAASAGWAVPHSKVCWVSERPNVLVLDEKGALKQQGEPSLAYPDGWAIQVNVPAAPRATTAPAI